MKLVELQQKYKAFIYLEERSNGGFFVRFTVDRPKNMGWYTSGPLKNGRIYKEAKDAEQMVEKYVLHNMKENDVEYIGVVDRKTLQEKIKCYSDQQESLHTEAITP